MQQTQARRHRAQATSPPTPRHRRNADGCVCEMFHGPHRRGRPQEDMTIRRCSLHDQMVETHPFSKRSLQIQPTTFRKRVRNDRMREFPFLSDDFACSVSLLSLCLCISVPCSTFAFLPISNLSLPVFSPAFASSSRVFYSSKKKTHAQDKADAHLNTNKHPLLSPRPVRPYSCIHLSLYVKIYIYIYIYRERYQLLCLRSVLLFKIAIKTPTSCSFSPCSNL